MKRLLAVLGLFVVAATDSGDTDNIADTSNRNSFASRTNKGGADTNNSTERFASGEWGIKDSMGNPTA